LNAKIERVNKEIDKTKEKISEFQAKLRELEKQKTEFENIEIVEAVRGMNIPLTGLPAILKALRDQSGAPFTSGQHGPKSTTNTDKEETEQ
jgi:DNA-binding transcriptional regulator GbsR (MarR family)